jgi:hypothetical protein
MKKSDYYAFVLHDGCRASAFIRVNNKFFICDPDRIVISPQTQIIQIQSGKKNELKVSNQIDSIIFRTDTHPVEEFERFIEDFNDTSKTPNSWTYSKSLDLDPRKNKIKVTVINLKGFSKCSNPHVACCVGVAIVPDNLPLEKNKDQLYTKLNGINVPVEEYSPNKKGKYKFKEVLEKAASEI